MKLLMMSLTPLDAMPAENPIVVIEDISVDQCLVLVIITSDCCW